MRDEAQKIVDLCKEFVRAMDRLEGALPAMSTTLSKEERADVLETVLAYLDSGEVRGSFTREIARELIAQLSASSMYADYRGSTDAYIQ